MRINHRFNWLVLALALLALAAQAQQPAASDEIKGDVAAAAHGWQMIEDGALLIDVRSPEEYAEGHVKGAANIPHTEIDKIVELIGPDHDRSVVLYCRSGHRASLVEKALQDKGYTGVFNATGWEALAATHPGSGLDKTCQNGCD